MTQQLPSSTTVARRHIAWLRLHRPAMTPREAAHLIGVGASAWRGDWTWRAVTLAYARAWDALPEDVRRGGNQ